MVEDLCALHAELPRNGLVVWTSGNVSARVPGGMLIKPSGVPYEALTPESMVLCDLDGTPLTDSLAPSSDAATHGFIYQHMPDVGGIVHTHSPYATAWAVRGEPIPCVMTAMADEFGGEIPVGPFALIGDEAIGRGVVDTLSGHRSRVVLMRAHGVFALGDRPRDAVKAAVMCEDAARVALAARSLGPLQPLDAASVDALFHRYQNVYGQH